MIKIMKKEEKKVKEAGYHIAPPSPELDFSKVEFEIVALRT